MTSATRAIAPCTASLRHSRPAQRASPSPAPYQLTSLIFSFSP